MNTRIKELSRVAHSAADSTYAQAPDAIWLKEYNKKFAELIVRECCSAIRLDDAFNGGKFQRTILKHFGVEE